MSSSGKGCVFWITGLAGAGKSTVALLLDEWLREKSEKVVFLDGDELRTVLGAEGQYSYQERKQLAFVYCRLCKMLAEQGHDVVIATISMFHACHKWNRENLSYYYEIYLRVPREVLIKRNKRSFFTTKCQNVVGIDIPFEEPKEPDLVLDNHGELSPKKALERLCQCMMSGHRFLGLRVRQEITSASETVRKLPQIADLKSVNIRNMNRLKIGDHRGFGAVSDAEVIS